MSRELRIILSMSLVVKGTGGKSVSTVLAEALLAGTVWITPQHCMSKIKHACCGKIESIWIPSVGYYDPHRETTKWHQPEMVKA